MQSGRIFYMHTSYLSTYVQPNYVVQREKPLVWGMNGLGSSCSLILGAC